MTSQNEDPLHLVIRLAGKSTESVIISLEDLAHIAQALTEITHSIIKNKVDKKRTNEEIKALCSLDVVSIKKGSALLDIRVKQIGQQKLTVSSENIMQDLIGVVNEVENKESNLSVQQLAQVDQLLRPLTKPQAKITITLLRGSRQIAASKDLTTETRKTVKELINKYGKISRGTVQGILKEVDLRTKSCQVQTISELVTVYFEERFGSEIISNLDKNVLLTFDKRTEKSKKRILISIRSLNTHNNYSKGFTGDELLNSGIVGKLSNRKDIQDSVSYSKKLRDDVFGD